MIKSFLPSATVFTSNGERIIQAIKCIEHRELGDWYVDLVAPLEYQSYLEKDYILVVPTKEKGDQPFRINNPKITDKVDVRAYHIGFDTRNYAVELSTILNGNAQACLDELTTNIDGTHPFTFTSAIATLKSFSVVDSSLYNALIQIADEYNGILDFNGWTVTITSSIGADNGVVLAYGKNIQESEINENWDLVVTRLKPIGNNGILLTPAWLDADVSYDRPYTKIMNFDTDDVSNLGLVAQLYLDRYKVPRVNYKVKADVEQNVALGDAVTVNARQFTTTAEVLSFDYNPLINRVIQVEFGNFRPTLKQFFSDQAQVIEEKTIKRAQVKIDEVNGVVTILASDYESGLLEGAKYIFDGTSASFYTDGFKLYDASNNLKVYFDTVLGNYVFEGSIDTSLDATVGEKLFLQKVTPTTATELSQFRNGKYGIRFGDDVDIDGYPYAFITAYDRSVLAGLPDPFYGMSLKCDSNMDLEAEYVNLIKGSIRFPSTQVPSSNANDLDDYVEGAWTPVLFGGASAGTGTYSAQVGTFTKIGNVVHFDIYIVWTAHTGTGQMKISLPFTAGSGVESVCNVFPASLTFSNSLAGVILSGDDEISLFTYASNAARSVLNMDTAATLSISGTYRV